MQDSEPSWLVMVDRGATTMWEALGRNEARTEQRASR